ncbi:MAG: cytochrome c-type bioproteinis protein CcmF, partial [Hyphomonadaceae bacterium]
MIIELGHFALFIALAAALLQAISGLYAGHTRNLTYSNMANGASDVAFIAVIFSFFVLVYAYLTSDFSVKNVAENSHTLKPLIYKIAGAWGNHEGSMLLWVVVAAGYGSSLAHFGKSLSFGLKARAMGIQGLIIAAVVGYVVFASNPFLPFLYLGYVGLSLVYSLAIAGLMEGKIDAAWARWLRPWVLASWVFLTIGILLGAYWAYYELGWGGWWFWDPVENASFMPWLLATALLHSAIVTEKRGALAAWTVLLSILAFSLSLLGTFLVRSGVITSVHAFALDPGRGIWILMILAFFTGGGLLLYGLKGAKMASDKGLFAPISRETALILNNLFLVVACFTILVGTLYPLVGEAIYGR